MARETNIQLRRGAASDWSSVNPTLDDGELGLDTTNFAIKIGNSTNTWSALPEVLASVNPSLESTDGNKSNYLVLVSPVINFKTVADTNIFTVPAGHFFFVQQMEVITTAITSPGSAPYVRFGKVGSLALFQSIIQTTSNSLLARHSIDSTANGQEGSFTATFGITTASTATEHKGVAVIKGYLTPCSKLNLCSSSSS